MELLQHALAGAFAFAVIVAGTMNAGAYAQYMPLYPELSGEIDMGLILPPTGDPARHGEEILAATRLAVSDFNGYLTGKDVGWSLNLVVEGPQELPTSSLDRLQALHAKGVKIVLGPGTDSGLQSVKGYAGANGMLLLSCCSTSPLLAIPGDAIFRMAPGDSNQGTAIGKIIRDAGIEVMVPVWRADSWGASLEESARKSFVFRGGMADEGISYDPGVSEFSSEASTLADIVRGYVDEHGADRVGVLYMGFGEVLPFMRAASGHGVLGDVRWFGSDANAREPGLVEDAAGLQFATDTRYTTVQVASGKNDLSRHVDESLMAELGRAPSTHASSAYDAVWVVGLAIYREENTYDERLWLALPDGAPLLAIDREQSTDVKVLSRAIPAAAAGHTGAMGSTRLNGAGDLAQTNYDVWGIRNGAWALEETYFSATNAIQLEGRSKTTAKIVLDGPVRIGGLTYGSPTGRDTAVAMHQARGDFNGYLLEIGATWTLDVLFKRSIGNPAEALDYVVGFDAGGIDVVVGPHADAELDGIRKYVDSNGMLALSYGSTAPSLAIAGDSILRFVPDDTNQARVIAKYLEGIGVTNIVPMWSDAWDGALIEAITAEFTAAGGVVDDGVRYDIGSTQGYVASALALSERVAANIDDVGADRVVVVVPEAIIEIMTHASQHEPLLQVLWFTTDMAAHSHDPLYYPGVREFVNETGMIRVGLDPPPNPIQDRVISRVEDVYHGLPSRYAFYAYDTVWIAGLSILAADSAEADAVMAAIPGVLEDYSGAAGTFALNDAGDLDSATYSIFRMNDKFTAIETFDPESGSFVPAGTMVDDKPGDAASEPGSAARTPGGGCLIATAAYGSELAPQVQLLREIRDSTLLSTASGASFMTGFNQFYYSFSPAVADLERENVVFRDAVRVAITPALYTLSIMTLADQNSDASVTAFGLLAIAAMAGVYVAGPVLAIRAAGRKVRSRHGQAFAALQGESEA